MAGARRLCLRSQPLRRLRCCAVWRCQSLRGSLLRRTSLWTTPSSMGGPSPTLRYSKQVDGDVPFLITYDRDHPYPAVAHLSLLGYSNGAAALAVSASVAVAVTAAQLVSGPLATPPCVTSAS